MSKIEREEVCVPDWHRGVLDERIRDHEVLFVSKRLGVIDPSGTAGGLHPLDAPNNPLFADCQPKTP